MESREVVKERVRALRIELAKNNQISIETDLDFEILATALKNLEIDLILQKENTNGKI